MRGTARFIPETTLDELGLSSLERVELMMAIEQNFGTSMDESQFTAARTVGDLRTALGPGRRRRRSRSSSRAGTAARWRGWSARVSLATWILPIIRLFIWARAKGARIWTRFRGR